MMQTDLWVSFKDAECGGLCENWRTQLLFYTRQEYDWEQPVYTGAEEVLPEDAPVPLGKVVVMTTFVDANVHHALVNGRSVTRILHLFNKTIVDWYSKQQPTVETATYGSEFIAARTAMEQIIDMCL